MNTTVPMTTISPVERAAHRVGLALVAWSERRAARVVAPDPAPRSDIIRTHHERLALEARQRSWDTLAAATPRLR